MFLASTRAFSPFCLTAFFDPLSFSLLCPSRAVSAFLFTLKEHFGASRNEQQIAVSSAGLRVNAVSWTGPDRFDPGEKESASTGRRLDQGKSGNQA
jgi:hypothetical protein